MPSRVLVEPRFAQYSKLKIFGSLHIFSKLFGLRCVWVSDESKAFFVRYQWHFYNLNAFFSFELRNYLLKIFER